MEVLVPSPTGGTSGAGFPTFPRAWETSDADGACIERDSSHFPRIRTMWSALECPPKVR